MDVRNWEQRNSDVALNATNRELEWADQDERENIILCGEWETETSKKIAQEIAKNLRNYERSVAKKSSQTSEN